MKLSWGQSENSVIWNFFWIQKELYSISFQGTVATMITQPFDVMKTRMMNAKPGEYSVSCKDLKRLFKFWLDDDVTVMAWYKPKYSQTIQKVKEGTWKLLYQIHKREKNHPHCFELMLIFIKPFSISSNRERKCQFLNDFHVFFCCFFYTFQYIHLHYYLTHAFATYIQKPSKLPVFKLYLNFWSAVH